VPITLKVRASGRAQFTRDSQQELPVHRGAGDADGLGDLLDAVVAVVVHAPGLVELARGELGAPPADAAPAAVHARGPRPPPARTCTEKGPGLKAGPL